MRSYLELGHCEDRGGRPLWFGDEWTYEGGKELGDGVGIGGCQLTMVTLFWDQRGPLFTSCGAEAWRNVNESETEMRKGRQE
jgi:hypothetical protein